MGLKANEQYNGNISLRDSYKKIRAWYTANRDTNLASDANYRGASNALIDALPDDPSDLEIRAVLEQIIRGNLEWGFHQSDGQYKMAAYALGAIQSQSLPMFMSDQDRSALSKSPLSSLLM